MKTSLAVAVLSLVAANANAIEITPDNWESLTSGKTLFIKFFAPWCGNCKAMKPDWDKLMDAFSGSESKLVAEVDCAAEGQPLCADHDVKGIPTILFGDPTNLKEYMGQRDFATLKSFTDEDLNSVCSPTNIDFCDDDVKSQIKTYEAMGEENLALAVKAAAKKISNAKKIFAVKMMHLDEKVGDDFDPEMIEMYQEEEGKFVAARDNVIKTVKNSGFGLMKSVLNSMNANNSKEKGEDLSPKDEL